MYKLLLILKYLRRRYIAWVSLATVTLCTMLVLVVISVMGGWLRTFRQSFHGLRGDIIVQAKGMGGFEGYQDMVDGICALPEVGQGHAVPVIATFGLIAIGPYKTDGLQVLGYPFDKIGGVNNFPESLWFGYRRYIFEAKQKKWPGLSESQLASKELSPQELAAVIAKIPPIDIRLRSPYFYLEGGFLSHKARISSFYPMVAGDVVLEIRKDKNGDTQGRYINLYRIPVKLTVLGIVPGQTLDVAQATTSRNYFIVDDSHTGVYLNDSHSVYVPFELLQHDLQMDASTEDVDGKTVTHPARTSEIEIKIQPGANLDATRDKVQQIVNEVILKQSAGVLASTETSLGGVEVVTWEQSQATFLHAIENEKSLLVALFGLISLVAVFMIFCIFYMIVQEKTRDIGIIKSVGATSQGIAQIFLYYGLTIGLLGAGLGLLFAYLIVHNINELHAWLGKEFGVQIFKPEVYLFDKLPNTMNATEVTVICVVAIFSAVLGALAPAIVAAYRDPIRSLRWE